MSISSCLLYTSVEGYRRSKNQVYLKAAKKALRWYGKELTEQGFTTAGALDIFSIDKESAIPLLKGAVSMYREDKSEEWLVLAENAAWYLSTWQYSCTEKFSKETTPVSYTHLEVTFNQELEQVKDYLYIQNIRFEDRIEIIMDEKMCIRDR